MPMHDPLDDRDGFRTRPSPPDLRWETRGERGRHLYAGNALHPVAWGRPTAYPGLMLYEVYLPVAAKLPQFRSQPEMEADVERLVHGFFESVYV